ncbi:MAG: hypothetical protein ACOCUF_02765 [Patescibacteria group bacterium]
MNTKEETTLKLNIFEIFSLWWIVTAVFGLVLAMLGFFSHLLTWGFSLLIAALIIANIRFRQKGTTERVKKNKLAIEKLSRFSYFAAGVFLSLAILLSVTTQPTIFGGRDEGSYSNSAVLISQEGGLVYQSNLIEEFFEIYGPGKALNFPGFQYTSEGELKSQFLPGYPSWISNFYGLFGFEGFKMANFFPFLTLLLSFYLILNTFLKSNRFSSELLNSSQTEVGRERLAFLGTLLLATIFPLLVFYKFTLSEIFFASLLWFAIHLIVRYLQTKKFSLFKLLFIPLILMLFVRIETFIFIFLLLLIMILKDFNHLRQARYQLFFVLTGIAFFVSVAIMPNFFIDSFKSLAEVSLNPLSQEDLPAEKDSSEKSFLPDDWQNLYLLKVLYNYNFIPLALMFFFASFLLVKERKFLSNKESKKNNALLLVPILICSPSFIYLIDANISLDHPWMLRRFVFAIIPLFVLYSVLFLQRVQVRNKIFFNLIWIFILLGNFTLLMPAPSQNQADSKAKTENFLTFSQNKNLLQQIKEISKNFSRDDLILISRKSSGSGWSLMSEPMRNLFDLKAVYFFNPQDLEEIDQDDFNNVYLIVSEEEEVLYEDLNKTKTEEYTTQTSIINPSRNPLEKPAIESLETRGVIYKLNF